jgi:hypothetical protein
MNERIAHWKKVNTKEKPPAAIKPTKFYKAKEAEADAELPPAAVTIDSSDESVCSDDSAPFPLPLEQLNKYPVEQRKQQQEQNRFFNFFERYAIIRRVLDYVDPESPVMIKGNTVTDVNKSMQIWHLDDSSVCAKIIQCCQHSGKKGVRWAPNCELQPGLRRLYDSIVVTEVGASACGSKESVAGEEGQGEGDQAGVASAPAVALDKKNSPTSATETDQVDSSKEQVESSQEEGWNLNRVNCTDMDMQPCVDLAKAVPFNLNKFWESLVVKNRCDEDDVDDNEGQVRTRKQNPKRMKARESSSSTLSREVRCICLLLFCGTLFWITPYIQESLILNSLTHTPVHFTLDLRQIDEDEEPDLELDMGHSVKDSSVVNLDDVNVMMDSVIDTVLSNELKGMASEFLGKVRTFVSEDSCPVNDAENDADTSNNDAVNKRQ